MPETPSAGDLVEVFASEDEAEAMVIQGLLDSAEIESEIVSAIGAKDVLPVGSFAVRVSPEVAEEAKRIIDDYHQNPPDVELAESDDETAA